MKSIKIFILVLFLFAGFQVGSVFQHKWAVNKSIRCNVVVEGWGTIDGFFGPVETSWVGSGIIIDSNGTILTAKHCLENADKIRVTLPDGSKYVSYVYRISKTDDFGIIKLGIKTPNYEVLVDSSFIKSGRYIYHIGNSLGIWDNTFIEGKVVKNNFNRCFIEKAGSYFIFSEMEVQGGCSGGGVYTYDGRLIGIVVIGGNGATFIVPSRLIMDLVTE